jgi:adenosine deaminase
LAETPPGVGRIGGIYAPDAELALDGIPADDPEYIVDKIVDLLAQDAADGAVLVEISFGAGGLALMRPDFLSLFREAERLVQARYPRLCAEAICLLSLYDDPERVDVGRWQLETCLHMAEAGLAGVNFLVHPYATSATPTLWETAYRWAERAVDAGLGITVHAGEFSTADLAPALQMPGLRRVGHAVHAVDDARLLEALAQSGAAVECCPSVNVLLSGMPSYEQHPIRRLVASGIPVTLNTDLPVHACTTVGREYALAATLGFGLHDLAQFTRNAVEASFTSAARKSKLASEVQEWEDSLST